MPNYLFLICLAEANDMHVLASHRDDRGMQTFAQQCEHTQPPLAVVSSNGRLRSSILRAFFAGSNVIRIIIYRYSKKSLRSKVPVLQMGLRACTFKFRCEDQ